MNFFFDRNIAVHLAKMLDGFDRDNQILHQDWDARFTRTTTDVELIETVSSDQPKPVWVSADLAQRNRVPEERRALCDSNMTAVFLRGGFHDLTFHDQARLLINVWPNVVHQCATSVPTIFEVGNRVNTLKVERFCLTRELLAPAKKKRRKRRS